MAPFPLHATKLDGLPVAECALTTPEIDVDKLIYFRPSIPTAHIEKICADFMLEDAKKQSHYFTADEISDIMAKIPTETAWTRPFLPTPMDTSSLTYFKVHRDRVYIHPQNYVTKLVLRTEACPNNVDLWLFNSEVCVMPFSKQPDGSWELVCNRNIFGSNLVDVSECDYLTPVQQQNSIPFHHYDHVSIKFDVVPASFTLTQTNFLVPAQTPRKSAVPVESVCLQLKDYTTDLPNPPRLVGLDTENNVTNIKFTGLTGPARLILIYGLHDKSYTATLPIVNGFVHCKRADVCADETLIAGSREKFLAESQRDNSICFSKIDTVLLQMDTQSENVTIKYTFFDV